MHPTAPDGPAIEDRAHRFETCSILLAKLQIQPCLLDPSAFPRPCRNNPARKTDRTVFRRVEADQSPMTRISLSSRAPTDSSSDPPGTSSCGVQAWTTPYRRESANLYSIGRIGEFGVAHFGLHLEVRPGDRPPGPLRQQPGARRVVSEGSHHHPRWAVMDFPADCPHQSDCHCARRETLANGCDVHEYRWILGFSSIQPSLCRSLLPTRGRNCYLRLHPNRRPHLRRLPPKRVGPPASGVADFRGVTGGVYKARERIHPGVADPGLLATPTSCSRVADCNPN